MDNDQESTPSKDFKNIAAILAKTNVSSLSEPSAYAAFAALPALAKILQGSASKSNGTQPGFLAAYENIQKMEADALANRLQKTVQKLDADISELKSQSGNILQREDIENIVEDLKEAREQAIDLGNNVIVPKDLNLRLVRADLLDRLDEYRSHEGHNFLMLGLFGGGASGIIVNWLTSTDNVKTDSSITLLCILIALILFFGYKTFETSRRASNVKKQIFEDS